MCGERITHNFSIAEGPAGWNGKARHLYGTGPPRTLESGSLREVWAAATAPRAAA